MRLSSSQTLFAALLLAAFAAPASAQVPGEEFMIQWDLDGDGRVVLAEAEERRGLVFDMFDDNADGRFSADEYALIDEHKALEAEIGKGPGQAQGQGRGKGADRAGDLGFATAAAEGMQAFDADGDGVVTRAEFVAGTAIWFAGRDRDGDGAITAADFGR